MRKAAQNVIDQQINDVILALEDCITLGCQISRGMDEAEATKLHKALKQRLADALTALFCPFAPGH